MQPTETGIDALTRAAYRGGAFFHQAAGAMDQVGQRVGRALGYLGQVAENSIAHQQISAGAKSGAELIAAKEAEWNSIVRDPNTDPNDPTTAQKFLEQSLEPALEQFQNGFGTQASDKFGEEFAERARQHFFAKTAADMSSLQGTAVKQNYIDTVNTLSGAVVNDPRSLDFALDTVDHSLGAKIATSPTLSATDAVRLKAELGETGKQQLVKSAAIGMIQQDPDADLSTFEGKYAAYIKPGEIQQFQTAARGYKRIAESEARSARVQQDYDARAAFNGAANDLELSTLPQAAGGQPTLPTDYWDRVRKLATMPGAALEPERLKAMITNGEVLTTRLGKPEPLANVSHSETIDLLNQIRGGQMADNTAIYKAYGADKLTNADFNFLQTEFANARTPDGQRLNAARKLFMDRYSKLIDGAMTDTGTPSLLGTQRLYAFEMDAQRAEADLRKQGKDPSLVYDPSSEYFFGSPEKIAAYHVSLQEAQRYDTTMKAMDKTNAPAPPRAAAAPLVRQNGHTYQRQPDGSYKAID